MSADITVGEPEGSYLEAHKYEVEIKLELVTVFKL